jgi:hypothetical protein
VVAPPVWFRDRNICGEGKAVQKLNDTWNVLLLLEPATLCWILKANDFLFSTMVVRVEYLTNLDTLIAICIRFDPLVVAVICVGWIFRQSDWITRAIVEICPTFKAAV